MLHLTENNFAAEAERYPGSVMVMFYDSRCGKCAMMKSVVERLEARYRGRIRFCLVEVEESPKLARKYGADMVPTFVSFQDGEVYGIMQGVIGEDVFEERLKELL